MKAILNVNYPVLGWKSGTIVTILRHSEVVASKVLVERRPGGFKAWCHLDDMTPME